MAGMATHIDLLTRCMRDEYCYNADGELLFVRPRGAPRLRYELGIIDIAPAEIAVVPRGVKFSVELPDGPARGYLCENYGGAFTLPERGPIGANCLAAWRKALAATGAFHRAANRAAHRPRPIHGDHHLRNSGPHPSMTGMCKRTSAIIPALRIGVAR